ncbi:MAG: hypothetical protein ACP5NK_05925 [Thermoplasmata archaeon]
MAVGSLSGNRSSMRNDVLSLAYLMMAVMGGWVNAQGQWVKDFSYSKVVNLPLFAWTFTTSGVSWYSVGLFDDILGTSMIITGLIMFRRHSQINIGLVRNFLLFIPFIAAYFVMDGINFYLFLSYYYGNLPIALYGEIWNTVLYFGMLPMLILSCIIILSSDRSSIVRSGNV